MVSCAASVFEEYNLMVMMYLSYTHALSHRKAKNNKQYFTAV